VKTDAASVVAGVSTYSFRPLDGSGRWRIYLGEPEGSETLRISTALDDPASVAVAAYVALGTAASLRSAATRAWV
jgi:hypothetical protein